MIGPRGLSHMKGIEEEQSRWNLSKGICEGVRWTDLHQLYSFCFLLKRAIGLCLKELYKQKIA